MADPARAERAAAGPSLSVIVPVHDAAEAIRPCLAAIRGSVTDRDEIIVVDDGSTDGGVPTQDERVTCVRLDTNVGRGPARNIGAWKARGDVLVFVDSDVVVHADAFDVIRAAFHERPERSSLIGAYDDRPAWPGLVSQYRNLLHHRTHHTHGPTAMHFWTGIGAVRRQVFAQVGGLDETDWARDMEDVEFGHRLVDAGFVIDVLPQVQGTHLKQFTVRSMVMTDLFHRAIPWSTLLLRTGFRRDAFVLSLPNTLSVVAAASTVAALAATALVGLSPAFAAVAFGGYLAVNVPLWSFFVERRGWVFALGCVPLHLLHSLSSGTGFAVAVTAHAARTVLDRLQRRGAIAPPASRSGGDSR